MISKQRIEALLARFPLAAVTAYFALIVVFVFITVDSALQVLQRRDAVAAASEILTRIEVRDPARAPAAPTDVGVPTGSPFIEGTTVSVAGAALLRRLTAANQADERQYLVVPGRSPGSAVQDRFHHGDLDI